MIMKFVEITLHWRCTSVRFSIQHPRTLDRPSRAGVRVGPSPPAMVGPRYAGGWSVGRWYQISHSGAQIHFLDDAHSKHASATTPADIYKYRYRNRNTCAHIDRYRPTDKNHIIIRIMLVVMRYFPIGDVEQIGPKGILVAYDRQYSN